ncbi:MAG: thermitase, partial [Ilumatobacteraceae bacterium]
MRGGTYEDVNRRSMTRRHKFAAMAVGALLLTLQGPLTSVADAVTPPADTASPADSTEVASLLVKMVAGLSAADQQAVIARNGGVETSVVAPLRLHVIDVDRALLSEFQQRYASDAGVQRVEVETTREAQALPSDPSYGGQWSLPQIGWDQAYGTVTPNGSATIAVLDTGVDATQPDLVGHLVPGYSAFPGGTSTTDPNGHGTVMATIAAASTDNATGIAGVAYAGVQVMPVQVLDENGIGQDGDIIAGVVAAADAGADVILMAFSSPSYSPDLQDAVNYAWSTGAVLVAATGNDASATATYPAGDAKVIGVSATDSTDALWSGSDFGADTFLAAPGVDIAAGTPGGGTTSITGTSASAAIVAGAAGLLRANDAAASNATIVGRLARNADAAGTTDQTGNGRVNLARALADTDTAPVVPAGAGASGGPFVGPYVAAAQLNGELQGQSNPGCSSGGLCPWQTTGLTGWSELQTVPLRMFFVAGQLGASARTFTVSIDHSAGSSAGLAGLTNFAKSSNVTVTGGLPGGITFTTTQGGDVWNYTFTAVTSDSNPGFVSF